MGKQMIDSYLWEQLHFIQEYVAVDIPELYTEHSEVSWHK